MAAIAGSRSPNTHPVVVSERNPSKRYVTGLYVATVASQPVKASLGKNVVVKNANGKNNKNDELTAPGFPVLRAIAYGNPVNANPQRAASNINANIPSTPDAKLTPKTSPSIMTGILRRITTNMSATIRPSRSACRLTGEINRRSK